LVEIYTATTKQRIIQTAIENGIHEAARRFNAPVSTVALWAKGKSKYKRNAEKYEDSFRLSALHQYHNEQNFRKVARALQIPRSTLQSWVRNAQKGSVKNYNIATKNNVLSEFETGMGIMALSRKYSIPKSTIQGWIKLQEHSHHWVIASPNGPTSIGRCKICGEVRQDFANSFEGNGHWQTAIQRLKGKESRKDASIPPINTFV
jgi:transposase-like protein